MDSGDADPLDNTNICSDPVEQLAVNSLVLDYYKKFGRKRDLEQYFSLSTAPGDIKDTTSRFWRRMKALTDSSDSNEKPSESSAELCRISIQCSMPGPSSQTEPENKPKSKRDSKASDSDSPPIISEEPARNSGNSDNESNKSEDNQTKSMNASLDTSNKPISPTSSVTSQRKLEWDSLADVGYNLESDPKTSGSSLSTLERFALMQQYANNDGKEDIGAPTAHSTLIDKNESGKATKSTKGKGNLGKRKEIHNKDILEVTVPQNPSNPSQSINVNLTKHISFNVDQDTPVVRNTEKEVIINPTSEMCSEPDQYSASKERSTRGMPESSVKSSASTSSSKRKNRESNLQHIPVLISLNSLKRRSRWRQRKSRVVRKKPPKTKQKQQSKSHEKSGEQVSDAESFEYMPGHIYNLKNNKNEASKTKNSAGNKSSLESSGITTESSNTCTSNTVFSKDLEKCINLLSTALQRHQNDAHLKKKLVKDIVNRLVKTKYKDDDSAVEMLTAMNLSKRLVKSGASGKKHYTTTSTSDANNSGDTTKRPTKSILRMENFDASAIASTSQSVPNLPIATGNKEGAKIPFPKAINTSRTESDISMRDIGSSDFLKTSSEEIYQKYLAALKKEDAYKKYLREKQEFLKLKLTSSANPPRLPHLQRVRDIKYDRIEDLMKDLTRNNYADGSGDASNLEGGFTCGSTNDNRNLNLRQHTSHSVFTLSNSDRDHKSDKSRKAQIRKRLEDELRLTLGAPRKNHIKENCVCKVHQQSCRLADSAVQVNIELETRSPRHSSTCRNIPPHQLQPSKITVSTKSTSINPDEFAALSCAKCSKSTELVNSSKHGISPKVNERKDIAYSSPRVFQIDCQESCSDSSRDDETKKKKFRTISKTSQTILPIKIYDTKPGTSRSISDSEDKESYEENPPANFVLDAGEIIENMYSKNLIHEITRSVQTDVSFNPRLVNPIEADVVQITENYVQIESENYREVSKHASTEDCVTHISYSETQNSVACSCKLSEENLCKSVQNAETQTNFLTGSDLFPIANIPIIGKNIDYSIPLQGTNMTLLVSVDSNNPKVMQSMKTTQDRNPNIRYKNDEAGSSSQRRDNYNSPRNSQRDHVSSQNNLQNNRTDFKLKNNEHYNKQQISKDIECYNVAITDKNKESLIHDYNSRISNRQGNNSPRKEKLIDIPQSHNVKFATFPMTEKKTVVRSNTDTALTEIEKSGNIFKFKQSDQIIQSTQECVPAERITTNIDSKLKYDSDRKNTDMIIKENEQENVFEGDQMVSKDRELNHKQILKSFNTLHDGDGIAGTSKDLICDTIKDITRRYSKHDIDKSKNKRHFKAIISLLNYLLDTDDDTDPDSKENPVTSNSNNTDSYTSSDNKSSSTKSKPFNQETSNTSANSKTSSGSKISSEIPKKLERKAPRNDTNKPIKIKDNEATTSEPTKVIETKPTKIITKPNNKIDACTTYSPKTADKGTQLIPNKFKNTKYTRSDSTISSEIPSTSTDSMTCRLLKKIKKECEKYHFKRCRSCHYDKYDSSSSTSIHCDDCKKKHHCHCKMHKCKLHKHSKSCDRKVPIAYNLILQPSDSLPCEEPTVPKCPMQNVVVKVPSKKPCPQNPTHHIPTPVSKPTSASNSPRMRRKSPASETTSRTDDYKRAQTLTVKDYLVQNRPDFIDRTSQRQDCLKYISNARAQHRQVQRELLSMQLDRTGLSRVSASDLQRLAREVGADLRRRKLAPKFLSEREMKKHSEKIYKKLPEVVQKKEEKRKENIKKTNLLMADIFKKSLQKRTLRGSVDISNYSAVIKI